MTMDLEDNLRSSVAHFTYSTEQKVMIKAYPEGSKNCANSLKEIVKCKNPKFQ